MNHVFNGITDENEIEMYSLLYKPMEFVLWFSVRRADIDFDCKQNKFWLTVSHVSAK